MSPESPRKSSGYEKIDSVVVKTGVGAGILMGICAAVGAVHSVITLNTQESKPFIVGTTSNIAPPEPPPIDKVNPKAKEVDSIHVEASFDSTIGVNQDADGEMDQEMNLGNVDQSVGPISGADNEIDFNLTEKEAAEVRRRIKKLLESDGSSEELKAEALKRIDTIIEKATKKGRK